MFNLTNPPQNQSQACFICGDYGHLETVCPSDQDDPYFCSCPAEAQPHEPHSYEEISTWKVS